MTRILRALRLALSFLTIFRVPIRDDEVTSISLADARFAYPVVGLALGLILFGLSEILRASGVGSGPSAVLLMASIAILSGGLHLDGLADTADGLFLWGDPERRLAVMRDPHVGSFGVVSLILLLLAKFAALESLGGPGRSLAVLGASTISRTLILVSAGLAPYARPEGTGRVLIESTGGRDSLVASAVVLAVGGTVAGCQGLISGGVALGVATGLTRLARSRLGGITGDLLGSVVELGEMTFLFVFASMVGSSIAK